jgi:hypothetical protein
VLGGILIDKYGIIANFVVTLILQLISTLPLILVTSAIPSEKPQVPSAAAGSGDEGAPAAQRWEGRGIELAAARTSQGVSSPPSREANEWQQYDDGLEDDLEMLHAAAGALGADDDDEGEGSGAVDVHLLLGERSDKPDVFWEETSR